MKKIIFLSLLTVVSVSSIAAAQSGMAGAPGGDTPPKARCEHGHRGHRAEFLAKADTNHDGTVSDAEKQAFFQARGKERFAKRDANGDGKLTPNEISRMPQERFAKLDTNGDGALTPEELKAGFRHGKGHRKGHRGRSATN